MQDFFDVFTLSFKTNMEARSIILLCLGKVFLIEKFRNVLQGDNRFKVIKKSLKIH